MVNKVNVTSITKELNNLNEVRLTKDKSNNVQLQKGMFVLADLGNEQNGSIQSGVRLAYITSNNTCNKYSSVVTIVPCTSKVNSKKQLPTHVFISNESEIVERDSLALAEQVMPINKSQIKRVLGMASEEIVKMIDKAVLCQLGIAM